MVWVPGKRAVLLALERPASCPQGRPGRAGPEALLLPPHAAGPRGPHREAAQLCAPGEVTRRPQWGPRSLAWDPFAEGWLPTAVRMLVSCSGRNQ